MTHTQHTQTQHTQHTQTQHTQTQHTQPQHTQTHTHTHTHTHTSTAGSTKSNTNKTLQSTGQLRTALILQVKINLARAKDRNFASGAKILLRFGQIVAVTKAIDQGIKNSFYPLHRGSPVLNWYLNKLYTFPCNRLHAKFGLTPGTFYRKKILFGEVKIEA